MAKGNKEILIEVLEEKREEATSAVASLINLKNDQFLLIITLFDVPEEVFNDAIRNAKIIEEGIHQTIERIKNDDEL